MTTLAEFLLARIAEDEEAARRAVDNGPPEWTHDGSIYAGHESNEVVSWVYGDRSAHIARHDPARVLAECEAKRRIAENERAARAAMGSAPLEVQMKSQDGPYAAYWRGQDWVLRVHAAVYADHEDYREEWRPYGGDA